MSCESCPLGRQVENCEDCELFKQTETLERIAKETQSIKFWGKLPDKEKLSLMSRAQLILVPAVRE